MFPNQNTKFAKKRKRFNCYSITVETILCTSDVPQGSDISPLSAMKNIIHSCWKVMSTSPLHHLTTKSK